VSGMDATGNALDCRVRFSWSVRPWRQCSRDCGFGVQYRHVFCPTGNDLDCAEANRPLNSRKCFSTSGCAPDQLASLVNVTLDGTNFLPVLTETSTFGFVQQLALSSPTEVSLGFESRQPDLPAGVAAGDTIEVQGSVELSVDAGSGVVDWAADAVPSVRAGLATYLSVGVTAVTVSQVREVLRDSAVRRLAEVGVSFDFSVASRGDELASIEYRLRQASVEQTPGTLATAVHAAVSAQMAEGLLEPRDARVTGIGVPRMLVPTTIAPPVVVTTTRESSGGESPDGTSYATTAAASTTGPPFVGTVPPGASVTVKPDTDVPRTILSSVVLRLLVAGTQADESKLRTTVVEAVESALSGLSQDLHVNVTVHAGEPAEVSIVVGILDRSSMSQGALVFEVNERLSDLNQDLMQRLGDGSVVTVKSGNVVRSDDPYLDAKGSDVDVADESGGGAGGIVASVLALLALSAAAVMARRHLVAGKLVLEAGKPKKPAAAWPEAPAPPPSFRLPSLAAVMSPKRPWSSRKHDKDDASTTGSLLSNPRASDRPVSSGSNASSPSRPSIGRSPGEQLAGARSPEAAPKPSWSVNAVPPPPVFGVEELPALPADEVNLPETTTSPAASASHSSPPAGDLDPWSMPLSPDCCATSSATSLAAGSRPPTRKPVGAGRTAEWAWQ